MNYISHLSAFYSKLYKDSRFTPHHISLYMAIFQLWNTARFETFHINRQETMKLAKIGSVNTYLKCLKDLQKWKFIDYQPSKSISVGSRIRVITFDNTTGNTGDIPVRPYIKHNKTTINITIKEVEDFFKKENFDPAEASKFFNHYQAKGWMMGSSPIQNWQAAAVNWIANAAKFNTAGNSKSNLKKDNSLQPGNLSAPTNKKYDEPL